MNAAFYILSVLGLAIALPMEAAAADPKFKWTSNGVSEELVIPEGRIVAAPQADPEEGRLPLSFARAVALALAALVDVPKPRIGEVTLTFVTLNNEKRWFYLINADHFMGEGESRVRHSFHVAVLMDGTAIRGVK